MIIGKFFVPATLGYFHRAKSLNNLVIQHSSASLISVLFPTLSKVQNDLTRFQNIITESLNIIIFLVFFIIGNLYLNSQEIIVMLFSERWLTSVAFFKLLILSSFAYPISSLLVTVLSSRGNSKAFLRLEIYKKLLLSFNFFILYFLGIKFYLYGVIVTSFFSLMINMLFVSNEIKLPFMFLLKPVFVQIIISFVATIFVIFIMDNIDFNGLFIMAIKLILFSTIYLFLNNLFKVNSYFYFKSEVFYFLNKKKY